MTFITLPRQFAQGFVRNAEARWVGSVLPDGAESLEWLRLLRHGLQGQSAHWGSVVNVVGGKEGGKRLYSIL